jgi:hypothetical protein
MILAALALLAIPADMPIDPRASVPLASVVSTHAFGDCHFGVASNGAPLPDPKCTPGAINPTLTVRVLTDPRFRTGMVRDAITTEAQKEAVYGWYGLKKPAHNAGANQTCELDHLVDLGSGGADALSNIWPQCQRPTDPPVPVGQRWFKVKDADAEHVMIAALKAGETDEQLQEQQRRIAADWTQLDKPEPTKSPAAQGVADDTTPIPTT